jgi:hypothetical protein
MKSLFTPIAIAASARGRLLMFNLLVMAVTLMVSAVAIIGFNRAGDLQEQMQARTLSEMTGSMELSRDTANVTIAAIRLSQVVGALEYQSESARLKQTQMALQSTLQSMAQSPLAHSDPALVQRISQRSEALENSVAQLLILGQQRHWQRNQMLSELYQCQMYLHQIDSIAARTHALQSTLGLRAEIDRLLNIAIQTSFPRAALLQLDKVMADWTDEHTDALLSDKILRFKQTQSGLTPLARQLSASDLAITFYAYHIKALVGMLNGDINFSVQQVVNESAQRIRQTHHELSSIIVFIGLFALLSLVITGFAGWYIYRNLGKSACRGCNGATNWATWPVHSMFSPATRLRWSGPRAYSRKKAPSWKTLSWRCETVLRCLTGAADWWCGTRAIPFCWGWRIHYCFAASIIANC